ncbi:phosphatase PAP2 family protein [Lacrimispora algidixylanolytica]|uniref:Phosphoesterase n=1 Tax=Lacrimispora algidixylanolytica TaxID=94868 RepID=A0A419T1M3_9FIRM|nr:phosphatase PAP2 family protein [Lacrimispora algidixylanolytica]RKD31470.1 phosphoesterase [Lacrimispora algidixylanolytica]
MKSTLKKYSHVWLLGYAFIYLPWFLYLEKTVTSNYHIMYIALDDLIPFNEFFIIPYLLWFLYVAGAVAYFFFTDVKSYYKLCTMLFTGMTISLLVCTVFPNGTDFRPLIDPSKNVFAKIVSYLYSADTCTNVFPSIHVYNSICVHLAVLRSERLSKYGILKISSFVLMVSICLATVFLKQHSAIDGFGSIAMAYIMYYFVYAGSYEPSRKKVSEKAIG